MNSIRVIVKIILIFLFFNTVAFAENKLPSNDVILTWWKKNSTEEMTIEDKPEPIGLRNKETAYLVPVGFYSRGRNSTWRIIMVRPHIKAVQELGEAAGRDFIVHDLNHDGISEIETTLIYSGQGTTMGAKSIIQFDGWEPIILYQKKFHDNLGCCGPPISEQSGSRPCEALEVKWKFFDFDGDGSDDLTEDIITMKGPDPDNLVTKKTVNTFPFKDNSFAWMKDFAGLNLKPIHPDESVYETLNERISINNSLSSLKLVDSALESFTQLTIVARDEIPNQKLNTIGNTDWETQHLGFSNWTKTLQGTLLKQEYLIKKLNYHLACNDYETKKINKEALLNAENKFRLAEKRFQKWWDSFSIAD